MRTYFHRNLELGYDEFATAKFIAEKLTDYGILFQNKIAGTDVLGIIEGSHKGALSHYGPKWMRFQSEKKTIIRLFRRKKYHACLWPRCTYGDVTRCRKYSPAIARLSFRNGTTSLSTGRRKITHRGRQTNARFRCFPRLPTMCFYGQHVWRITMRWKSHIGMDTRQRSIHRNGLN